MLTSVHRKNLNHNLPLTLAYSSLNDPVHATQETVTTDAIVSVSGKAISRPSWTFDSVRCVDHEMLTNAEEEQYEYRAG